MSLLCAHAVSHLQSSRQRRTEEKLYFVSDEDNLDEDYIRQKTIEINETSSNIDECVRASKTYVRTCSL